MDLGSHSRSVAPWCTHARANRAGRLHVGHVMPTDVARLCRIMPHVRGWCLLLPRSRSRSGSWGNDDGNRFGRWHNVSTTAMAQANRRRGLNGGDVLVNKQQPKGKRQVTSARPWRCCAPAAELPRFLIWWPHGNASCSRR